MSSISIVMLYKENCKAEGHVLTRFKIARHYFYDKMTQEEIAKTISCHRNTVGNVIRTCKEYATETAWRYLKTTKQLSRERLQDLFSFLETLSTRPHAHPTQLGYEEEACIVQKHASLGFGPQRMYTHLKREKEDMSVYTLAKIRGVYKRNNLRKQTKRTKNGNRRSLYNYTEIAAFEQLQYDTKDILDQKALPEEIYSLFADHTELPRYQWTIIDAKTKTRFLAWSKKLSSWYGFSFLLFVICWLRAHGQWHHIQTQMDGGSEFCSASPKKLTLWNTLLAPLNASVIQTEGVKWKQNMVERSHRSDDEEFYVPRGYHIKSKTDFLIEAQQWLLYWNTEREHSGIGMHDRTPEEVLEQLGHHQAHRLVRFPALILDDLFLPFSQLQAMVRNPQNAQNVLTYYQQPTF